MKKIVIIKEIVKEYGLIFSLFIGGIACAVFFISKTEKDKSANASINNEAMVYPVYSLSQDSSDSTFVLGYKIIRRGSITREYLYFNKKEENGKLIEQKLKTCGDFLGENKVELHYSDTARLEKIVEGKKNKWRLYVPKHTQFKGVIELGGKIIISDEAETEEVIPDNLIIFF